MTHAALQTNLRPLCAVKWAGHRGTNAVCPHLHEVLEESNPGTEGRVGAGAGEGDKQSVLHGDRVGDGCGSGHTGTGKTVSSMLHVFNSHHPAAATIAVTFTYAPRVGGARRRRPLWSPSSLEAVVSWGPLNRPSVPGLRGSLAAAKRLRGLPDWASGEGGGGLLRSCGKAWTEAQTQASHGHPPRRP